MEISEENQGFKQNRFTLYAGRVRNDADLQRSPKHQKKRFKHQEVSLSPVFFNVIMNQIINQIKSTGKGYTHLIAEIKIVCYSDDAAIITESEDDLQRLLYVFL